MASCTTTEPTSSPSSPANSPTDALTAAADAPATETLPDFHSGETSVPTPAPTPTTDLAWDVVEQQKVARLAEKTMRLFARPDRPADAWWADLEPLLSAQARQDYYGVDPARVPVTAVTGPARLVPLDTELVAIAHIPTDAGLYAVTLSRTPQAPAWMVERITPPEADPHAGEG